MAETTTIRRTTTTSPVAQRRLARLRRYRTRTTTTRTIRRGLPIIIPVVVGMGVAAYLLWGRKDPEENVVRNGGGGGGGGGVPGPPIGPRPPNTWGNLPRATVTATDGVFARTGPGSNFPLGTGGGNSATETKDPNKNMAPWAGTTVAVLQTGIQGPGAQEWWKIITPGGYEFFAAAVTSGGKRLLTHVASSAPLPAPGATAVAGTRVGQLPAYAYAQPVYPNYGPAYGQPVYPGYPPYAASPWGAWGYPGNLEIVGRRR